MKRSNGMPNGWEFLTGDVDWQGVNGTWYKKAADGSYFLVVFTNMCEYTPEEVERGEVEEYVAEVRRIYLKDIPAKERESALRSYGWTWNQTDPAMSPQILDHDGKVIFDRDDVWLALVECLDSYGLYSPMWHKSSNKYAMRLRAEARRHAEELMKDADLLEEQLSRPVNAIGTTAEEFGRGDVYRGLERYVNDPAQSSDPAKDITLKMLTGKTRGEIRAEHYKAGPADCPFTIFDPRHYQFGEKCGCYNKEHRDTIMMQPTRKGGWGYTAATFKRKGISIE